MNYQGFTDIIKQWDTKTNQWFFRHFYLIFFQVILVVTFVVFFINTINTINLSSEIVNTSLVERLLISQNITQLIMLFLMLLNSFWMLILLANVFRVRSVLKNIDFSLSRRSNTASRPKDE